MITKVILQADGDLDLQAGVAAAALKRGFKPEDKGLLIYNVYGSCFAVKENATSITIYPQKNISEYDKQNMEYVE